MHAMRTLFMVCTCSANEYTSHSTTIQAKFTIVFVLVDDWGWANVSYHCDPPTKEVVTPNINCLVKGLELDQHYAYQFCSPS